MKLTRIQGQPSWRFASDKVEAAVTQLAGHLGPVDFRLGRKIVQPFSIAPWAGDKKLVAEQPPLLQAMRGDFFCAPFGGNDQPWRGEKHPAHGETAQAPWHFESLRKEAGRTELHLSLKIKARPGKVDKLIRLRKGHAAVYCQHVMSGMSGPMNPGHHATLKFPDEPGSGLISTSPMQFGQVLPVAFEKPENGGYNALKVGATFSRLDRVPATDGSLANLSQYPARRGFEDLVMMAHQATSDFAWIAASFPKEGYVWFALKDPRVLRSTVFWISNGGRHYPPWNGRHVNVLGMEDVTSYFHLGLAESVTPNNWTRRGIPTALTLHPKKPLVVNYIMAMAAIPGGFGRVKNISRHGGGVTLHSEKGRTVKVPLDTEFLYSKAS